MAAEGLDCEFTVVDGEYAKRKIWQFMILSGTTDGHAKAAEISRALLRGILELARNIKPDDVSEEAAAKRKAELADFKNLRFIARISIEKSKDPAFDDKNKLEAITPDQRQWVAVEQIAASGQAELPGMAGDTSYGEARAARRSSGTGRRIDPMGKLSEQEDAWQAEATADAVAGARSMAQSQAGLANTPAGKLSDSQWGWIISAAIFAWIKTRYRQAIAEGLAQRSDTSRKWIRRRVTAPSCNRSCRNLPIRQRSTGQSLWRVGRSKRWPALSSRPATDR